MPPLLTLERELRDLGPSVVGVLVGLPVTALFFFFLERLRPLNAGQRWLRAGTGTDVGYWFLSAITLVASRIVVTLSMLAVVSLFGMALDGGLRHGFGPLGRQPRSVAVIEMLVVADFIAYWTHRWFHTVPLLWRFHAVHHSSDEIDWLSALRFHPVNDVLTQCANTLPLFCLGFPLDALTPYMSVLGLYAMFIHGNLNVALRPLAYVVTSPLYHRVHHARTHTDPGWNFAGLFPIFDKLFGTYHFPVEPPVALGIDDEAMPDGFLEQLMHPLRRPREPRSPHERLRAAQSVSEVEGDGF